MNEEIQKIIDTLPKNKIDLTLISEEYREHADDDLDKQFKVMIDLLEECKDITWHLSPYIITNDSAHDAEIWVNLPCGGVGTLSTWKDHHRSICVIFVPSFNICKGEFDVTKHRLGEIVNYTVYDIIESFFYDDMINNMFNKSLQTAKGLKWQLIDYITNRPYFLGLNIPKIIHEFENRMYELINRGKMNAIWSMNTFKLESEEDMKKFGGKEYTKEYIQHFMEYIDVDSLILI